MKFKASDGFTLKYLQCADGNYQCILDQARLSVATPFAYKGSYKAQRFLAFCLSGRCDPHAIEQNKTLACAWRLIISASGSPELSQDDADYLTSDCGKLDSSARAIAERQAANLNKHLKH